MTKHRGLQQADQATMNTNNQHPGFNPSLSFSNYQQLPLMVPNLSTVEGIVNINTNPPNDFSDGDKVVSNHLQCMMSNLRLSSPHLDPIRFHQLPQQNQERETMRPSIPNKPVPNVSNWIVNHQKIDINDASAHPLLVS
ncbi:hypothetical protein ACTXT7_006949 [Hymenolepis weldensis]